MIPRVGVVMLGVRDMTTSLKFYKEVLGMVAKVEGPTFAFLEAGPVMIGLRHTPDLKDTSDERRVEIVFSVEDIHSAHQFLQSRGVVFRVEPRPASGGQYVTDFRDPDGHVLAIFGPGKV